MHDTSRHQDVRRGSRGLVAAGTFLFAYFLARVLIPLGESGSPGAIGAALLPVGPFVWLILEIVRGVRGLDELEQRIQLEALAVAFPLTLVLLMTLGLLELAVRLPPDDLSYRHVWAIVPMLYFIGLGIARRRYR